MARWRVAKAVAAALLAAGGVAIPATAANATSHPCYASKGSISGVGYGDAWCTGSGSGRVRAKVLCSQFQGGQYWNYGSWVYTPNTKSRAYCAYGDAVVIADYEWAP